jgi:hypothetical protein
VFDPIFVFHPLFDVLIIEQRDLPQLRGSLHLICGMAEATIGALANLATTTAADRGVVAALTQANSRLAKQLEEKSTKLRELKALLNQERRDRRGPRSFNPSAINYCWSHGYKVGKTHTSRTCNTPKPGHKMEATQADTMVGSQANRE